MPVAARAVVRRMRGGAQAWLMEAADGHFYVVKFKNNPQHRRILVNEWVAAVLLDYLEIATPKVAAVSIDGNFLQENSAVAIELGSRRIPVEPGWHFGSRFPGHPDRLAVYDFLPDPLLVRVANLDHFLAVLVFDKWVANADSRQAIFFRARLRDWFAGREHAGEVGFVAQMIDHGYAFNGPHWQFQDSSLSGLYPRRVVYERVRGFQDFEPWLERVVHFPDTVLDEAYRSVPREWLADGEEEELEKVLERLLQRRARVPDLLAACRNASGNPFPNWRL